MDSHWGVVIMTLVASGIGSFVGSYLKQKGANLATHEDVDNLIGQVAAVTQKTKEIEAKISNEMWDRQKRWEVKRDAVFSVAAGLRAMDAALQHLGATLKVLQTRSETTSAAQREVRSEALKGWNSACGDFKSAHVQAMIVCGADLQRTIASADDIVHEVVRAMLRGDMIVFDQDYPRVRNAMEEVYAAMRDELGIDSGSALAAEPTEVEVI